MNNLDTFTKPNWSGSNKLAQLKADIVSQGGAVAIYDYVNGSGATGYSVSVAQPSSVGGWACMDTVTGANKNYSTGSFVIAGAHPTYVASGFMENLDNGTYTYSGSNSNWDPIYRNENGRYMAFNINYDFYGGWWMITWDVDTNYTEADYSTYSSASPDTSSWGVFGADGAGTVTLGPPSGGPGNPCQ